MFKSYLIHSYQQVLIKMIYNGSKLLKLIFIFKKADHPLKNHPTSPVSKVFLGKNKLTLTLLTRDTANDCAWSL